MKRTIAHALLAAWVCLAAPALAADYLGAPLPPGGQEVKGAEGRLQRTYAQPAAELYRFFQEALKGQKDLKFHELRGELLVEDFGDRPWHKITVAAAGANACTLTITQDSWTWIIGMLALRFVGVFIVLLVLYLAMGLATRLISLSLARQTRSA